MVRSFEPTSIKITGSSESHFFFVYSLVLEYIRIIDKKRIDVK